MGPAVTAIVGNPLATAAEAQRRGLAFPNGCLRVHVAGDAAKIQRGETVVLCDGWERAIAEKLRTVLERMGCKFETAPQ